MPVISKKCPICRKNETVEYRPFCSKTCADEDLSHWLSERYVLPTQNSDEDESISEMDS
jgi:endogenous inhibitor of DNA gyrase (YacG/DUF329 family)